MRCVVEIAGFSLSRPEQLARAAALLNWFLHEAPRGGVTAGDLAGALRAEAQRRPDAAERDLLLQVAACLDRQAARLSGQTDGQIVPRAE
ncbi:hypothetical protein [Alsobacter soli]|uniref:hypothetical protein n=1 Tax=Alsobacter soli TaxID=2109933 RepID=UPI0011B29826|nr:hypothetical protein [Alsobacter soli]